MGREQKRREQFKNKNKKVEEELDTSIKLTTLLKLVGFMVILLFVIYYVLAVFVTKEISISNGNANSSNSEEETENNATTVSDRILASNIFNQKEDEYYVYFYDFSDENEAVASVMSNISTKVYKVDTSSSLNSKYVTDEKGNKKAKKVEDLRVKNSTVIKIDNDKIVEYYEGSSEILDGLSK